MTTSDLIQIILMGSLVVVTGIYVWRTFAISNAAKKQATASVKMAEEMREQRIMASRPVIIEKAVHKTEYKTEYKDVPYLVSKVLRRTAVSDHFSHFEVYNAGNGPAIELIISLLNKEKASMHSQRKTFLRAGEPPIEFRPSNIVNLEESITYYLVCEYQSILSSSPRKMWYQTWLPFKPSKSSEKGKIYVVAGELEFKEATEKERIDAFSSRSKPK